MFATLTGRLTASHPPDSNADGSRQMGISLPGTSYLTGSWLSLMGVEPPPGFNGTPMGAGEFSGSGQRPAVRQVPPLHSGGNRPLPNRTTATIASHTAPKAVTMAVCPLKHGRGKRQPSGRFRPSTLVETGRCRWGGLSLSGHSPEHSGLSPHGAKPATVEWGNALRV